MRCNNVTEIYSLFTGQLVIENPVFVSSKLNVVIDVDGDMASATRELEYKFSFAGEDASNTNNDNNNNRLIECFLTKDIQY